MKKVHTSVKPDKFHSLCVAHATKWWGGVWLMILWMILFIQNIQGRETFGPETHHDPVTTSDCDNFIKIDGSSNVNHFHFVQEIRKTEDILESPASQKDSFKLKVPVKDFKTSNSRMYEDFLYLIRAGEFPHIEIIIHFDNRTPGPERQKIAPEVEIELAGEEHTYKIPGKIHECKNQDIHISGEITISMNDFGLDPPTKFMGMVKVSNEVFINFGLTLKN